MQIHPITHNLCDMEIGHPARLQRDGKRLDLRHAFPDRLGAGMTVALASEKAAKFGNQPHHLPQGWGQWALV